MLIGEASLKSAAFSPRLVLLLGDLRAAGCTVWLEGLRLRFDRPDAAPGEEGDLKTVFSRYRDVAEWLPEPKAEPAPAEPTPRAATLTLPRWGAARRAEAKTHAFRHK